MILRRGAIGWLPSADSCEEGAPGNRSGESTRFRSAAIDHLESVRDCLLRIMTQPPDVFQEMTRLQWWGVTRPGLRPAIGWPGGIQQVDCWPLHISKLTLFL